MATATTVRVFGGIVAMREFDNIVQKRKFSQLLRESENQLARTFSPPPNTNLVVAQYTLGADKTPDGKLTRIEYRLVFDFVDIEAETDAETNADAEAKTDAGANAKTDSHSTNY